MTTLLGFPVRLSTDAPKDAILLHPDVAREIERLAFRNGGAAVLYRVSGEIKKGSDVVLETACEK